MLNINVIQIVLLIFILFALSRAVLRFRGKQITIFEFLFWFIVWVVVGFLVMLPDTTNILAGIFGVGRGVDVIIYLSIILLFYLMFRLYVRIENMEQNVTKIVRQVAIKREPKAARPVKKKPVRKK